jgi:hypothetical protein
MAHDLPNNFRCHARSPYSANFIDSAENASFFYPTYLQPFIHRGFHPARNGHCPKYVQPFPPDPQSPNALLEPVSTRSPIRATHRGLKPQPINNANIAKSRFPRRVFTCAACRSRFPSSALSQLPVRTPMRRTPLTRLMLAAASGLNRPEAAASYATRRTAASRRLIVVAASCFCSKKIRYRRTTVRLNASRGSEQYQSTNLLIA